jgi:hypothetical protein
MGKSKAEDSKAFPDTNSWLAAMNASEAVNAEMISSKDAVDYVVDKVRNNKNV